MGLGEKSSHLSYPIIKSIDRQFEEAKQSKKKYKKSKFPIWEFVHIEIPIFKYAVIDMIRIFVPILILSIISLLIFVQENATDGNGFTTLAKRIASGCSLMIAYIALIPMMRSKLPPTPSLTLIEILIYSSTIPNFLAIISNLSTHFIDYSHFFADYTPFSDGLFIVSFIISVFSFIILVFFMIIFSKKSHQSDYFIDHPK